MFRSLSDLEKCSIGATDGEIGRVKDCYFDDKSWVLRYFVVETGAWLANRCVLISPISVSKADWPAKSLPVAITKKQVEDSPSIDSDLPVSRQHEMSYLGYYGYPYYWGGAGLWGAGAFPGLLLSGVGYGGTDSAYRQAQAQGARADAEADAERHSHEDHHLRSGNAMLRYRIHASDGDLGHVRELLIDEDSWAVRYLIADTSNWWLGHRVLISPQWIQNVSWADEQVDVNLTRAAVKTAPPYLPDQPLDRPLEKAVFSHHQREGYWSEQASARRGSTSRPAV